MTPRVDYSPLLSRCADAIQAGQSVYVVTATRATRWTPTTWRRWAGKYGDPIYVAASGDLRMRQGRGSVCIGGATSGLLVRVEVRA